MSRIPWTAAELSGGHITHLLLAAYLAFASVPALAIPRDTPTDHASAVAYMASPASLNCWVWARTREDMLCAAQRFGKLTIFASRHGVRWHTVATTGLPARCQTDGVPAYVLSSGRDRSRTWHVALLCSRTGLYETRDTLRWSLSVAANWVPRSLDGAASLLPIRTSDRKDVATVVALASLNGNAVFDPSNRGRQAPGTPTTTLQFLPSAKDGGEVFATGLTGEASPRLMLFACDIDLSCMRPVHDFGAASMLQAWRHGDRSLVLNLTAANKLSLWSGKPGAFDASGTNLMRIAFPHASQKLVPLSAYAAQRQGQLVVRVAARSRNAWPRFAILLRHHHRWSVLRRMSRGRGPWNCWADSPSAQQRIAFMPGGELIAAGAVCRTAEQVDRGTGTPQLFVSRDLGATWKTARRV